MESLRKAWESIRTMWAGLSAAQRASVAVLVVALAAAVVWGLSAAGSVGERQLVGRDTSYEEQAEILAQLESLGIPHRVSNGAIYVPADRIDEANLKVRGGDDMKMPDPGLFADRWQREKQWQVSLQARLGRMIRPLKGVRKATVQLIPTSERGLRGDRTEGSAAVVIEMQPTVDVTPDLVNSIVQTVSGGSGIKAENVKVISPRGVHTVGDSEMASVGTLHDQELSMARQIAQRVEKLLPIEARVMATVKLSPKRVETEDLKITPGAPGSEESRTKTVYENSRRVLKEFTPPGAQIESLSVAVVIPVSERTPNIPAEGAARDELIAKITGIVRTATGIQQDNLITVAAIPVAAPAPVTSTVWEDGWDLVSHNAGHAALVLLALAIAYALWRVLRASVERTPAVTLEESAALAGAPAAESEAARLREDVSEAALRAPREAAETVRRMMERG